MDKQQLDELLKQLHAELSQTASVDVESREALRTLMNDIQGLLNRAEGEQAKSYQPLLDGLNRAVAQFEVSHPKLALAITQAINALVDIGV
jgi:predicted component of type VI protein secretion system